MRIGIVTTWYERGAAYVSRQYTEALRREGHEVHIFARDGEYAIGDPIWDDQWVHWGRRTPWMDSSGVDHRDFLRWLRARRIELVIFNEQRNLSAVHLCNALGVRTVAYVDYYKELDIDGFAAYDGLICNTQRHHSVFAWHPGAFFLPWGTDTALFAPTSESMVELVNKSCVTFFHSAGMSPVRKGTDYVLRAFARLHDAARLVIHSQVDLARWLPKLQPLIADLVRSGRCRIVVESVPAPGLYHLGDVYVYPARLDGIGLTVCEALSCGLPAIVTDNAPMNEFIPDDTVGLRVDVDRYVSRHDGYYWPQSLVDLDDLVAKMGIYATTPERVIQGKSSARDYVVRERDWTKNAAALGDHLANLPILAQKRTPPPRTRLKDRVKTILRNLSNALDAGKF